MKANLRKQLLEGRKNHSSEFLVYSLIGYDKEYDIAVNEFSTFEASKEFAKTNDKVVAIVGRKKVWFHDEV